jgi:lysophospholipase L1-like esterase
MIQRGYGGAKLSDFAVYAPRIFNFHKCKAIVLFVANDITGSNQDKTPEEVASLFRNVLKTIRKDHPSVPVFWIEITPTVSRWKVWPEIQKTNNLIKTICGKRKNTYFINTASAFLNENGLPKDELFRADQLHLNEKGYAVWRELIRKELDNVINK